ncbi:hypothetical protein NHX12_029980 [Muraenolepis orangiensis]|uniref:Bactericidal permeability-increasing protein n=1 Tax=Muraenolepis orangiensis TaxID=630683 RepID=A0A9Q0EAD8_9TELE|nr:hypothetical protein NHX12_029980 [Muraenolepis orangiensis]
MFPWRWLALLALIPLSLSADAGVKVKLTQKGLDFGRELVVRSLQEKLKSIKVPDISGTQRVKPIGKVQYSLSEMRIGKFVLANSVTRLTPGTGVTLSITKAFLSLHGKWRVKYFRVIKDSGSFDLGVKDLAITTSISIRSDETGRPAVATASCTSSQGGMKIKFHGGASWLYNLFTSFIEKALRTSLQKQICPLVAKSVSDLNQYLKSINVLAPVDKYAEIAYSMVSSPEISNSAIGFSLKGEFYNRGLHEEPPFSPRPFVLPYQDQRMLYIGISAFTLNSACFVYNKAGALSIKITDDMIPAISPIRLTTRAFGVFIPQIAKMFPGLKMELEVKAVKDPLITMEADKVTLEVISSLTAYAVQTNSSLSPLFVLNMGANVSARVYMTGNKVAGEITLNRMDMSLEKSYVGDFQVTSINHILQSVLKVVLLPIVNVRLRKGFPLPSLGKLDLVNAQLQALEVKMFPWRWLALLALIPLSLSADAGVKVKLTQKGLDFGRELVVRSLQEKLKSIKVPDISGTQRVKPIGKVQYSLSEMRIGKFVLANSVTRLAPGTGVTLSITKVFLSLHGKWRVKYFRVIKDSGSFDLGVKDLAITTSISIRSDETGRPAVATASCTSSQGGVNIKLHGGASWLYNLFTSFIEKALRTSLQKQICPLVAKSVSDLNQYLKSINVLAPVDKYAEIAYSMVSSPGISNSAIGFSLKGEFYNRGLHEEPPFSPRPFVLPYQDQRMLYIGISAFTLNSACFVYNKAGALSIKITDDMIPAISPIRLTTRAFGVFIPQIAKMFPGLKMELEVKAVKDPLITMEADKVTLEVISSLTAYAVQTNSSLSPLFVLNMGANVSARVYMTGNKVAGEITLNRMDMSLEKSYVGDFQVTSIQQVFQMLLKVVVLPRINDYLQNGYPLPSMGKFNLVNAQLQALEGYLLIGTDIEFSG